MDIIGTVTSIRETADRILRLGEEYYKASEKLDDYRLQVEALRQGHEEFKSNLTRYGNQAPSTDARLKKKMEAAASSLKAEEMRLERVKNIAQYCYCYPDLMLAAIPDALTLSIKSAPDNVRKMLSSRVDDARLLKDVVLSQPFSAPSLHDPLFVQLEIEKALYAKLEGKTSKPKHVVLLHGGPGMGKSTLARHIACHYKEDGRAGAGEVLEKCSFDHVFYLECGPEADVEAKQLELLQYLGPCQDIGASTSGKYVSVQKLLSALLSEQKVLIILDDVWDPEFLGKFVEFFGTNVKVLVTSQNARLWEHSSAIEMRVEFEEASSILAKHAGLPNTDDILRRIVEETEGHPLALASLATAISRKRSTDIDEWREAEKSLRNLLKQEDTLPVYNRKYPRSFWSSMRLSVQSISDEDRQLLLLASLCAGPSIPEEVMKIFCQQSKMKEVAASFSKRRNNLEDRSLLTIQSEPPWLDEESSRRTWSLHGLQKEFIKTEMKEERENLATAFLCEGENANAKSTEVYSQERILTSLCALYFDHDLAERAERKLGVAIKTRESKRGVVEEIIWLIHKPTDAEWTETSAAVAKRVLSDYICDRTVKKDDINYLLSLLSSKEATSMALRWIRFLKMAEMAATLEKIEEICTTHVLSFYDSIKHHPPTEIRASRSADCLWQSPELFTVPYVNGTDRVFIQGMN